MIDCRFAVCCVCLATILFAAVGCGRSNRAAVTGRVTLDGAPVDGGVISFIPLGDTPGPPAWVEIYAGSYAIPAHVGAAVGTSRVEIRWARKTGKMLPALPPAPTSEEVVEAVPARYNRRSELKAEIKPGQNQVDLELKSK